MKLGVFGLVASAKHQKMRTLTALAQAVNDDKLALCDSEETLSIDPAPSVAIDPASSCWYGIVR